MRSADDLSDEITVTFDPADPDSVENAITEVQNKWPEEEREAIRRALFSTMRESRTVVIPPGALG